MERVIAVVVVVVIVDNVDVAAAAKLVAVVVVEKMREKTFGIFVIVHRCCCEGRVTWFRIGSRLGRKSSTATTDSTVVRRKSTVNFILTRFYHIVPLHGGQIS